ncbi:MAG: BMC domain-containing protein [bacterium]|nr:BMC domain-containing protein [bacterium]
MALQALGMIETLGLVSSLEAADAAIKAAAVTLQEISFPGAGLATVKIVGEVSAVKSAVDAGVAAAQKVGKVVSVHIIPRPDDQIEPLINSVPAISQETGAADVLQPKVEKPKK